jgi:hypothetical protein
VNVALDTNVLVSTSRPDHRSEARAGRNAIPILCTAMLALSTAHAQGGGRSRAADDEHRAVVEIGAVAERSVGESKSSAGATVAVETTPVENWLELEFGITGLRAAGRSEFGADLLFKKPWRLSATSEFMAGVGPAVSRRFGTSPATSLSTEFVGDFMFWPTKSVGWYLEPSYGLTAWKGGERSVSLTAGLLIGWP